VRAAEGRQAAAQLGEASVEAAGEAQRHAEDIAENVSGVTHVQNNLRVGSSSPAGGSTSTETCARNSSV